MRTDGRLPIEPSRDIFLSLGRAARTYGLGENRLGPGQSIRVGVDSLFRKDSSFNQSPRVVFKNPQKLSACYFNNVIF